MNTDLSSKLSPDELTELAAQEARIQTHKASAFEFADALTIIRDKQLFRETHDTFAQYCELKLGISKSNAYRMIAEESLKNFPHGENLTPQQAKSISRLPKRKRMKVLKKAITIASEKSEPLSTTHIAEAAGKPVAPNSIVLELDHPKPLSLSRFQQAADALEAAIPPDVNDKTRMAYANILSLIVSRQANWHANNRPNHIKLNPYIS